MTMLKIYFLLCKMVKLIEVISKIRMPLFAEIIPGSAMNRDLYLKRTSPDYVKFTRFKVKVNKLHFDLNGSITDNTYVDVTTHWPDPGLKRLLNG